MAISASLLTSGTSTSTGSDTTASITPTSNALIEVDVTTQAFGGNTPPTVTLSGNGLTYVEVANVVFATGESQRITRFRAMGASPSAGSITIAKAGSTCIGCIWSVKQFTGVDTTGTNGSGAYVQTVTNQTTGGSPNTLTLTLAALADAVNNAVSAVFAQDNGDAMAPSSGYTELSDNLISTDLGMETQWKLPGTTTVTMSLSDFISQGGIASELKAAGGGGGATIRNTLLLMGVG